MYPISLSFLLSLPSLLLCNVYQAVNKPYYAAKDIWHWARINKWNSILLCVQETLEIRPLFNWAGLVMHEIDHGCIVYKYTESWSNGIAVDYDDDDEPFHPMHTSIQPNHYIHICVSLCTTEWSIRFCVNNCGYLSYVIYVITCYLYQTKNIIPIYI